MWGIPWKEGPPLVRCTEAMRKKASKKSSAGKKSAVAKKRAAVNKSGATPKNESPPRGVPVVGLGSSAGGLGALESFFTAMPADSGMAFVVVTHQHAGHTSLLPELLSEKTEMEVVEASSGLRIVPNRVYVASPGGQLAILNGKLQIFEPDENEAPSLLIDHSTKGSGRWG